MIEIRAGRTPAVIVNHERVAEHYRIPSINLAREVTERIDASEFTWEKDFRDLHPSPFGHDLYARSIGRMLDAAWSVDNAAPTTTSASMPSPLDSESYFHGRLGSPAVLFEAKKLVLGDGWRIEEKWRPEGNAGTRPGFVDVPAIVAERPGANMKLSFNGIGIGVFVAAGPDTGDIEFRVDENAWQNQTLFTQWSPGLHLPWAKMLASELPVGNHTLELRVSQQADERSKGHAIRIIHFLINDPSVAADGAPAFK